eukprot:UN07326
MNCFKFPHFQLWARPFSASIFQYEAKSFLRLKIISLLYALLAYTDYIL